MKQPVFGMERCGVEFVDGRDGLEVGFHLERSQTSSTRLGISTVEIGGEGVVHIYPSGN